MKKLIGGILQAVGILIACLSGLCTLYVVVMSLSGFDPSIGLSEILSGLLIIGIFGGIPFAIGLGLNTAGRRLVRLAKAEADGD